MNFGVIYLVVPAGESNIAGRIVPGSPGTIVCEKETHFPIFISESAAVEYARGVAAKKGTVYVMKATHFLEVPPNAVVAKTFNANGEAKVL